MNKLNKHNENIECDLHIANNSFSLLWQSRAPIKAAISALFDLFQTTKQNFNNTDLSSWHTQLAGKKLHICTSSK